jgi:hypothetical protein
MTIGAFKTRKGYKFIIDKNKVLSALVIMLTLF